MRLVAFRKRLESPQNRKEENTINKSLARRLLLVVISILNCIFSVGYMIELYHLSLDEHLIEYSDNITIDGSDFTLLFNLAVSGVNGLLIIFTVFFAILLTTIFILLFAILLRVTTIRKKDLVTESEVIFTKRFIIISSILALIIGILSTNLKLILYILCLSWQQPLFMTWIYYRALKNQWKKEQK